MALKLAARLVAWQRQHGRHGLPWQNTKDPYRVWLSEIMLQQTQVAAVVPYYQRFMDRFPDVEALACAPAEDVMSLWAGLGYYARARNLHACARSVMQDWGGRFPPDAKRLATLPGIGPSTAAAIASFCYAERIAILDGNVKRVFARYFAIEGDVTTKPVEQLLWKQATDALPTAIQLKRDPDIMTAYTQGLMDLGATLCTKHQPACRTCPIKKDCQAHIQGRTRELPWPRARKTTPERTTGMLIACHQGRILLEKRPESGIWGGLWSLPEVQSDTPVEQYCDRFGLKAKQTHSLTPFQHVFTHFRLTIFPVIAYLGSNRFTKSQIATRTDRLEWITVKDLHTLGLPAPVRKLLKGLLTDNMLG